MPELCQDEPVRTVPGPVSRGSASAPRERRLAILSAVRTSDKKVTVVVVDDHPFFRDGVTRGLLSSGQITVVGEAGSGARGASR